jgi:hypothetical protein
VPCGSAGAMAVSQDKTARVVHESKRRVGQIFILK